MRGQRSAKSQFGKVRVVRSLQRLSAIAMIAFGLAQPLMAQEVATPSILEPTQEPLDTALVEQQQASVPTLTPGACRAEATVVTSNTICQSSMTVPSLWWLEEQYRQLNGKLVNTWLAYPDASGLSRRVDLVVNQQVWSLLDYLERYKFTDWFGTTARDYGFNTRVFNVQGRLLAAYTCTSLSSSPTPQAMPTCRLYVNSLGKTGLGRPIQSAPGGSGANSKP
jgi:hypothetical protein